MQDRFKSRVWDKTTSTMHYNDFVITATGYVAKLEDLPEVARKRGVKLNAGVFLINQTNIDFDKNCTVMLSTGLKDEKGKIIFEGDIVNIDHGGLHYVKWCYNSFQLNPLFKNSYTIDIVDGEEITVIEDGYAISMVDDGITVIGNIYENPELLEVTNKIKENKEWK